MVISDTLYPKVRQAVIDGIHWLADIARTSTPEQSRECVDDLECRYDDWIGSIRSTYLTKTRQWHYYGTIWHSAQAARAMLEAKEAFGLADPAILAAAEKIGQFLLGLRIETGPDQGYLRCGGSKRRGGHNVASLVEALMGLYWLWKTTGQDRWTETLVEAGYWMINRSYLWGEGLFRGVYLPEEGRFWEHEDIWGPGTGWKRPHHEDEVWFRLYELTGDDRFTRVMIESSNHLLSMEDVPGNWMRYQPNLMDKGLIHARQAWWWGYPFAFTYQVTGDGKYLEAFRRSCQWYVVAQNYDGGMHYYTHKDGKRRSFGQCSSGMGCALVMWSEYRRLTGSDEFDEPSRRAIEYLLSVQFTRPEDPQLQGAFMEGLAGPDGTDRWGIEVRDLATIFTVLGFSRYADPARRPEPPAR